MSEQSQHTNSCVVSGWILEEPQIKTNKNGKNRIEFNMSVNGETCGDISAFCQIPSEDYYVKRLNEWRENPSAFFSLCGQYSQFKSLKNEWIHKFTLFHRASQTVPCAGFRFQAVVDQIQLLTNGDRRLLVNHQSEKMPEPELYELFVPGDLLDSSEVGSAIQVEGHVRRAVKADRYGGASGPIRAYVDNLIILAPF